MAERGVIFLGYALMSERGVAYLGYALMYVRSVKSTCRPSAGTPEPRRSSARPSTDRRGFGGPTLAVD